MRAAWRAGDSQRPVTIMLDLVFIGLSVLFFVVGLGYVAACDRLMK